MMKARQATVTTHTQQTTEKRPTFLFVLGFMQTGMAEKQLSVWQENERKHI